MSEFFQNFFLRWKRKTLNIERGTPWHEVFPNYIPFEKYFFINFHRIQCIRNAIMWIFLYINFEKLENKSSQRYWLSTSFLVIIFIEERMQIKSIFMKYFQWFEVGFDITPINKWIRKLQNGLQLIPQEGKMWCISQFTLS